MPNRALIIAIEKYASTVDGSISPLKGSVAAADRFRDWLIERQLVVSKNIQYCTDGRSPYKTTAGTRSKIIDAIKRLADYGQTTTTEVLFLFFSGHGFSYTGLPEQRGIPILVASNFKSLEASGDACLNLEEVRVELAKSLGNGEHFYFIDACRNSIEFSRIKVQNMGKTFKAADRGTPVLHTLFSTKAGAPAARKGDFVSTFIDGLKGKGRAKKWDDEGNARMYVTFGSLFRYLETKLTAQPPDKQEEGGGIGIILELPSIPRLKCDVVIEQADANDSFTLFLPNGKGEPPTRKFTGPQYSFSTVPEDYDLSVKTPGATVQRVEPRAPAKVDLYADCEVKFSKVRVRGATPPAPKMLAPVPLRIVGSPKNSRIRIRNVQSGDKYDAQPYETPLLPPGTYEAQLIEDEWITLRTWELTIKPRQKKATLDLSRQATTAGQQALVAALPRYARDDSNVEFSETIGSLANTDLGLWLSIVGASRVIGSQDAASGHLFYKLSPLPFLQFEDVQPGAAPIYALVGLRQPADSVGVGVSNDEDVQWGRAEQVRGMPGIYEYCNAAGRGPWLLSFALPDRPTLTLATYGLENRATVVVVAENESRELDVHQYLLPLAKLRQFLPAPVRRRIGDASLRPVSFIALAQQLFAHKRRLEPPKTSAAYRGWQELLLGKWWDPIIGIIGAYEMVRRQSHKHRKIVMDNLTKFYGELPDVAALDKLVGRSKRRPQSVPLLLDGVLAFDNYETLLPLPATSLDYGSAWTAWWGAVSSPDKAGSG